MRPTRSFPPTNGYGRYSRFWLSSEINETGEATLAGQQMYGRQEPLQAGECLVSFQPPQFVGPPLSGIVPATGDLGGVLGDVFDRFEHETHVAKETLIHS